MGWKSVKCFSKWKQRFLIALSELAVQRVTEIKKRTLDDLCVLFVNVTQKQSFPYSSIGDFITYWLIKRERMVCNQAYGMCSVWKHIGWSSVLAFYGIIIIVRWMFILVRRYWGTRAHKCDASTQKDPKLSFRRRRVKSLCSINSVIQVYWNVPSKVALQMQQENYFRVSVPNLNAWEVMSPLSPKLQWNHYPRLAFPFPLRNTLSGAGEFA